jgi:N-acylneuraminate cytidylyltransferase
MPPESYVEIDEPEDWIIAEMLLKRQFVTSDTVHIKMVLADCDGTLTDGGMYYSTDGEVLKKFNTRDGAGLRMLKESGIITGIITGESSNIVRKRAEKLGVDEILTGIGDKKSAINELCEKYGISMSETAFIGDDINDIEALGSVGLGICPAEAMPEVKAVSSLTTVACGGAGAVREAADYILRRAM